MERVKRLLRRWPRGYVALQRVYYGCLYFGETRVVGSRIHEWMWRGRRGVSQAELARTAAHPHRAPLVDAIAQRAPFQSVLEIGCNAGPNLLLLARAFPDVEFHGIDLNPRFVEAGRAWLAREGVRNVALSVGWADDLRPFADHSIDVTFTDATLMYLGPDKIERAIREMARVTRQHLLLNEWNLDGPGPSPRSVWYDLHWVHDYRALLAPHAAGDRVRVSRLPSGLWGPGGWEEHGALVEVAM